MLNPDARHGCMTQTLRRLAILRGSTHFSPASVERFFDGLAPGESASKMQSEPSSRSNFPAFFCINTSFAFPPPSLHLFTPVFLFDSRRTYGRFAPPLSVFIPETRHEKSGRRLFCHTHTSTSNTPVGGTPTLCYVRDHIHILSRLRWRTGTRVSPRCIRSLFSLGRSYLHR